MTWFEVWSGMTHALIFFFFFTECSRAGLSRVSKEGTAASAVEAAGLSSPFPSTSGCCTPALTLLRPLPVLVKKRKQERTHGQRIPQGTAATSCYLARRDGGVWRKASSRPSARLFCRQQRKGSFDVPGGARAGLQPAPAPAAAPWCQPHLRVSAGTFLQRPGQLGRSGRLLRIQPGLSWWAVLSLSWCYRRCFHLKKMKEKFSLT